MKNLNITGSHEKAFPPALDFDGANGYREILEPTVCFDTETGQCSIVGSCFMTNPMDFFEPLIEWVEQYFQTWESSLHMRMQIWFMNTSSCQLIYNLLKVLEDLWKAHKDIEVVWEYLEDNEDMKESGEDCMAIFELPIQLIPVQKVG